MSARFKGFHKGESRCGVRPGFSFWSPRGSCRTRELERIFKQTYYGISEILHPLIQNNHACVLPMQKPAPKKPWIIEICPASTLQSLKLYHLQYKGRTDQHRHNRWEILQEIVRIGPMHIDQPEICRKIIEDTGGDALDSVIAAMATFSALKNNVPPPKEWRDFWNTEGYVYV